MKDKSYGTSVNRCWTCKKNFTSLRRTARYCSNACKQKAWRLQHGQEMGETEAKQLTKYVLSRKKCEYCGDSFFVNKKGRPTQFCKPSHKVMYNRYKKEAAHNWIVQYPKLHEDIPFHDLPPSEWYRIIEGYGYTFSVTARAFQANWERLHGF